MILGSEVLKNPSVKQKLINASFLKWSSEKSTEPQYQGRVLDVVDNVLAVSYYEWMFGNVNDDGMVSDMELDQYIFFDSTLEMRANSKKSMQSVINSNSGEA